MIRKRVLLVVTIIPLLLGYYAASKHIGEHILLTGQSAFLNNNIVNTDTITLASQGNIYQLTQNGVNQITHTQSIMEPGVLNNGFVAISKNTNYSSLVEFDQSGNLLQTLFNGNTGDIDTMKWITDPAVNQQMDKIAYVSDQDRIQTGVPDNALYVFNLSTDGSSIIAKPDPYSGGLAHPVWDPANSNILFYDYYQYDPKTLNPYSTIMEYDNSTDDISPLTTNSQNAFQEAISANGKQILFLLRSADTLEVSLNLGVITNSGISKIHLLASGDYAYPQFSNLSGHIYFMQAQGNNGYDLYTATIQHNKLINILPITTGSQLQAISSFSVTKTQ